MPEFTEKRKCRKKENRSPSRFRRIRLCICAAILLYLIPGLYNGLYIRHYTIESDRIANPVRIVQISDLHSCHYGEGQKQLIEAVEAQEPDIIALTGDIFDDIREDTDTVAFLEGIAGKYPIFYVTGNHECESDAAAFAQKMAYLDTYGITRLTGECVSLTINGEQLAICGADDLHENLLGKEVRSEKDALDQLAGLPELYEGKGFPILLSHRPERFEEYIAAGFPLILSGHAHGGQWRIPFLVNGLFAPDQGLFPKYAGGKMEKDGSVMIISRGLARETTRVPRIYNRPEVVVIDLV